MRAGDFYWQDRKIQKLDIFICGKITSYFSSRLQRYKGNYLWRKGSNPDYNDPETLKFAIRNKYGYVNQELLEKLILEASGNDAE